MKNSKIKRLQKYVLKSPWKEITEKYWTKECEKELRRLCKEFGLFAKSLISTSQFEEIVGKKKYWEWYNKLKKKQNIYCGLGPQAYMNGFIEFKVHQFTTQPTLHTSLEQIPKHPEIKNKCILCNQTINLKEFDDYSFRYAVFNLKIKSIDDFCICKSCITKFSDKYKIKTSDKKESLKLLKRIYELYGRIPSSEDFNLSDVRELPKEKRKEFFRILLKIPYLHFYKENFGSWFESLIQSGILKEGVRRLSRGTMCKANDGHICLSLAEMDIDNWLFLNNIKHEKEPKYPKDNDLNPKGWLRADWKIGSCYVEFFGLKGTQDYDIKIELKKDLCNKKELKLIEIYRKDLKNLSSKFKSIKKRLKIVKK